MIIWKKKINAFLLEPNLKEKKKGQNFICLMNKKRERESSVIFELESEILIDPMHKKEYIKLDYMIFSKQWVKIIEVYAYSWKAKKDENVIL